MPIYYINIKTVSSGYHEVHKKGCFHMPDDKNRRYLGVFESCHGAIAEAIKTHPSAIGCYYCSNECHTG